MPEEESEGKGISLKQIFSSIKRKYKVVGLIAISIFVMNGFLAWYKWGNDRIYTGGFLLMISDPLSGGSGGGAGGGGFSPGGAAISNQLFEDIAKNKTNNDVPGLIVLLKSHLVLSPLAEKLDIDLGELQYLLTIKSMGGGSAGGGLAALKGGGSEGGLLQVSISIDNVKEGEKILTELSNIYLKVAAEQRQIRLTNGLNFLNQQAPGLQEKMNEIQLEISEFRGENSLLDPSRTGTSLKQRETKIRETILDIQASRSRLLQVRKEIKNGNVAVTRFQEAIGDGRSRASLTISDVDQSLLQQLLKVESELGAARAKYKPDSSIVIGLNTRLDNLKPLILANQLDAVDAALSLNAGRLAKSKAQAERLKDQFKHNERLIRKYEELQTKLQIARSKINGLENAREKFQLQITQSSIPWKLIAPPRMNKVPISPNPKRDLVVGAVLGIVVGSAIAYLIERLQNVFYDPKEVSTTLMTPLLAHIPYIDSLKGSQKQDHLVLVNGSDITLKEQVSPETEPSKEGHILSINKDYFEQPLRELYTAIKSFRDQSEVVKIVITNSIESEGSTLINILLAITMSELNQRVLLIDAHLRDARIHNLLDLDNSSGLYNLLENSSMRWQEILQYFDTRKNLSIITAGNTSTDATSLLSSIELKRLINELDSSEQFDYILIDTPPKSRYVDSTLLEKHCDGQILLVSLIKVKKDIAKQELYSKNEDDVPVIGLITNSIRKSSDKNKIIEESQYKNTGKQESMNENHVKKYLSIAWLRCINFKKLIVDWIEEQC